MSEEDAFEEELEGEEALEEPRTVKSLPGEGAQIRVSSSHSPHTHLILDRTLTFEEASSCLNTLGKDESGLRYAYLMISPIDRKLTNIEMILKFKHLFFVDVSGNNLSLEGLNVLAQMPFLIFLKAHRNILTSAALSVMPFLQVLSLSKNEITDTIGINQPILECLDLNFNVILSIEIKPENLLMLKQLELRGNELVELSGNFPPTLENLYLAQNRISRFNVFDMAALVNLKILHLRGNHIHKLRGFTSELANLKYLNLRNNNITKFRYFRELRSLTSLEILNVLENPVAGDFGRKPQGGEDDVDEEEGEEDGTRIPLLLFLPNLRRINKVPVSMEEREEAIDVREERLEEIMAEESSDDEIEPSGTEVTDYTRKGDGVETGSGEEDESEEEEEEEEEEEGGEGLEGGRVSKGSEDH